MIETFPVGTEIAIFLGNYTQDGLAQRGIVEEEEVMAETILFEDKYKVNIKDFSTTHEIDDFVAQRTGKKSLEVVLMSPDLISARGAVIPMVTLDIDDKFTKAIKK